MTDRNPNSGNFYQERVKFAGLLDRIKSHTGYKWSEMVEKLRDSLPADCPEEARRMLTWQKIQNVVYRYQPANLGKFEGPYLYLAAINLVAAWNAENSGNPLDISDIQIDPSALEFRVLALHGGGWTR